MSVKTSRAESYHSKDFDWDELRQQVESDSSLRFHLLPYESISDSNFNNDDSDDTKQDSYKDPQAWDRFHARHSTGRFFKERRYLLKEFPELASCRDHFTVLEVGCGNGSTVLPILRARESITLYACDCSSEALDRTKEMINDANLISSKHRFHPFICDFSTTGFPSWLTSAKLLQNHSTGFSVENEANDANALKCSSGGVDFITMIFTLSAVPYDKMPKAIAECFAVLKPGGLLLFRDYGVYDMTMLRFKPEQRIGYREYMRSDGTRSYFFCLDTIRDLISVAGFNEMELEYCRVKSSNRRNGKTMKRVWIHGKFQKPTFAT